MSLNHKTVMRQAGITGLVGLILVVAVGLLVGIFAYSKVAASIDTTDLTTAENTTFQNIRSNVTSGFDLTGIVPIVLAASALIGLIAGAFAFGRR